MSWIILIVAGIFEIGWAVGLKYSEGLTRAGASFATLASMAVSLGLLAAALRSLPLGTAYAVWTGIGTLGTVLFGILMLDESASPRRLFCLALIMAGIAGLKLLDPGGSS
jgi:quaternary ammonium compound-resistance protein SugE